MTTLADKAILSGDDNHPPMLEKEMYDSWKSRIELYMMNRQHGRMILESVENYPLLWPSIEENGVTRPKKYYELYATEAIQADCDVKTTNIILQGLPPEVYALVSNYKVAKELWERIQLLMQGTSLTKQERELNIKFLNTLPPEWSKFVTDIKQVKDLHTTNVDQLHAYLGQHEFHANEKGDDPIDATNHMMSFWTAVVTSRYPPTNNHVIQKTNAIVICDSKETLMLAEESCSKMLLKQKNLMMSENKVNTKPVDYAALNQLLQNFETRFVPQTKLSAKQVFWSQNYVNSEEPNLSTRPTQVEVAKELLMEKVLVITTLQDTLRKLKGKAVVDEAVILHPIYPKLLKINIAPLAPKLRNNRTARYDYLKHTQQETATLREIVKHERSLNPLNTSLDYAFKFGNDHVGKIMGYGDYQIRNVTISRVYFIEGRGHNLFFVGQFCDSDLEVAFCQYTYFIRNLEGLKDLVLAVAPTSTSSDLCFNGKKYIIVIVDDYSRFTRVKCLRSNDEAPDLIIKFLKMIQVQLKVPVRRIQTNNGTEFVNQTLREYYEQVGISHETSVARSTQQNGAHIGYNCPPKVLIISNPKSCNQTINNEPPQTLPSFDPPYYSEKEKSVPCVSKPNFVDESSKNFNPHPQPPIYSCEFCRSNAQYGHYCTPQAPFNNPEPGYSQDLNFPQNIHNFQQQYLCCDQCGGPHETFQCQQVIFHELCCENHGGPHENFQCQPCQPTNEGYYHEQNSCYNYNSSGFDQTQPSQFPVIHPSPQETSIEILHDQENVINSVQTFLRKLNRYSFFETPKVLLLAWDRVFKFKDALGTKQYKLEDIQELFRQLLNDVQNIHEELAEYINTPGWNRPAFYDDDDDDDDVDYTIAIILVLSIEEPIDSLSIEDEHLGTIPTTESDEVIKSSVEDLVPIPSESEGIPKHMCDVPFHDKSPPLDISKDQIEDFSESNNEVSSIDDDSFSIDNDSFSIDNIDFVEASPLDSELVSSEVMEIVIPEVGRIDDDILLTIKDDILREELLNVNLLITKIEAFNDNPTPSSDCKTKSSSTSLNSLLEETNTFYNSLPEFENFYFDLGKISSDSTTTHSDISLLDYEAFYFDDDHFADELIYIISLPEYDCFYFWNLPYPGELTSVLNSGIHENFSTTRVNLPIEDDHSPLLAYVVWIFLAYLTYPVIPPYLHPFGNEDTIFDPGITINHVYLFKPGLSHRCGAFNKFNTHRSHLNKWPMIINGKNIPILDVLLFYFYPP
uniref:Retrovirus-related Pol polyprotein from transposon TNT 1-94 n=1 Tax=Tanacetum cinerariifolium TaxID=118510 RepID=A0A6L2LIX5_TANCI|nr:retrovirus-related Pol polyprotein from transposon TNT 1-94 [Tanacetum cinerariifolium]